MSATVSIPSPRRWLTQLLSGQPHQVIGDPENPYLLRWFIIPPNRYCQIYWHRFIRSDEPTPHDHPWPFFSIVLRGRYFEETPAGQRRLRRAGQVAFRHATHTHRVTLDTSRSGAEKPCTTLIVTGPRIREWGFWCDSQRFIHHQDFGPGGCGDPS